jgi:diguanylate cyclase (GGDEF)-like protein
MMAQGEAMGILHLQSNPNGQTSPLTRKESFSASKQQLAGMVAEQIALPLANLRLRDTLRIQSIRDPLTGLFNRRFMEESLQLEVRRAARNGWPLGTIMLDLDNFKAHNDTFGHEVGDTCLREVGNFLQVHVRGEDLACRYGGDEFIIILPGASLQVTHKRAEKLREQIKHLRVPYNGRSLGPLTLSLGAAVFPEHGSTAECLLRAADGALYKAKKQGRDQVSVLSVTNNHLAEERFSLKNSEES